MFYLPVDGGNAVSKILFLKARAMKKDAATLVANGPQGTIYNDLNMSHSFRETRRYPRQQYNFTEPEVFVAGY